MSESYKKLNLLEENQMKKSKLVGTIGAIVIGIGAAIGIGALVKKGKNEDCEEGEYVYDETCEEADSEEASEE